MPRGVASLASLNYITESNPASVSGCSAVIKRAGQRGCTSECVCSFFQIAHTHQESVERKWETATIIITAARRDASQGLQKRTLPGVVVLCIYESRAEIAHNGMLGVRPRPAVQLFHSRPKLLNCAPLRLMIVTSPSGNNNVTGAWRVIVTMAIASFHLKVADLT
jgi:hypothetical protein